MAPLPPALWPRRSSRAWHGRWHSCRAIWHPATPSWKRLVQGWSRVLECFGPVLPMLKDEKNKGMIEPSKISFKKNKILNLLNLRVILSF